MSAPRGRLLRLCRKELRETLRDRRTTVTLLLMPLLVYPILSMTLQRFLLGTQADTAAAYLVGVASEEEGSLLTNFLQDRRSEPPPAIVEAAGGNVAEFRLRVVGDSDALDEELQERRLDVAVRIDVGAEQASAGPIRIELTSLDGDVQSEAARRLLVERIEWFNGAFATERARAARRWRGQPIRAELRSVGTGGATSLLGTIVPLVLVLMTITGAVYPAIDLTAGERERGTMEALIASPVPRGSLLLAKYVAVVSVALLTAVANLVAMFTSLWASGLLPLLLGPEAGMPWNALLQIFALLVLFSGFFSAVLLALTSFARSFKEAQAYLIPLMLLALTPAVLSLMPGVELAGPLSVVPLLNIILLSRDILAGEAMSGPVVAAVLSTVAYSAAALGVAARLFGSDAVLRGSEVSFTAALSRPHRPRAVPSPSEAAMTLALLFPIYFLLSNALVRLTDQAMAVRLVSSAAVLGLLFGGLPFLSALYCRDALATTFRIRRPAALTIFAGLWMGLGLWGAAHEIFLLGESLGIRGISPERIEGVESMLADWRTVSPWLVLGCLALVPAVVEELCFRGYLFSALRRSLTPLGTIAVTAVVFGLFHVLTGSTLLVERFLPTTAIGLALGWVAWRTGSVWPGVVIHLVHNGLLLLVAMNPQWLLEAGLGIEGQRHLPPLWLAATAASLAIGAALMGWSSRAPRDA